MGQWTWAAASARGTSHSRNNTRIQDAFSCSMDCDSGTFLAVLSDGAGSSLMGGEGASLVCRGLLSLAKAQISSGLPPSDKMIESWVDTLRARIAKAAENRSLKSRDFAATLILVVSSGANTLVAHIGDGCVVLQCAETSNWFAASWPDHGEYASTTFFVTDEPLPKLRISRHNDRISALAAFSDGIERLALDLELEQPHRPFFDGIIRPVVESAVIGRDAELCAMLGKYLNGEAINARTDDDKSLILAVSR